MFSSNSGDGGGSGGTGGAAGGGSGLLARVVAARAAKGAAGGGVAAKGQGLPTNATALVPGALAKRKGYGVARGGDDDGDGDEGRWGASGVPMSSAERGAVMRKLAARRGPAPGERLEAMAARIR